jgi:D-cysteine desulfhydrase
MSGAKIIFVTPGQISTAMDDAMKAYRTEGYKPYYVYGGGHTMEGGLAYIEAIEEMQNACGKMKWEPDYIFLASGTGSTQAGIMAGLDKLKLTTKVIGISIGRERLRAEEVINDFYDDLCTRYFINNTKRDITVVDDYLCGGYGKYNDDIKELSFNSLKKYGFTLDTTYTAKAFYGMQDYIKKNKIKGNVLFWHTGGIPNFLAEY